MSYKYDDSAKYYKEHQWCRVEDDGTCLIGITDFAQQALKDVVMVELPEVGDTVIYGEVFAAIESVKAVSDVHSPISGEVIEINEEVEDAPELTNTEPYSAWLIRVKPSSLDDDLAKLMSVKEYQQFCMK